MKQIIAVALLTVATLAAEAATVVLDTAGRAIAVNGLIVEGGSHAVTFFYHEGSVPPGPAFTVDFAIEAAEALAATLNESTATVVQDSRPSHYNFYAGTFWINAGAFSTGNQTPLVGVRRGNTSWFRTGPETGVWQNYFANITPVPVPAAVYLFGSALGLMGWMRRKAIA